MSYATIETAIKTMILTLTTTFLSGDVSLTDYRILDSGTDATHGTNKLVLRPGGIISRTMTNDTRSARTWDVLLDLFTVYQDDSDWADFKATRELLLGKLEDNQVITDAAGVHSFMNEITSLEDPAEVFDKMGAGPFFVTQRFRISIQENVN